MDTTMTLVRTPHALSATELLPLTQDDAWDRLTTQWMPNWLGIPSVPLLVGSDLVKNPGAHRQIVGRVLGSALGHRLRVMYVTALVQAPIVVQVSVAEVPEGTEMELRLEHIPSADDIEVLRDAWVGRLEHAAHEVREESRRRMTR